MRSGSFLGVAGLFLALPTVVGGCATQAPCLPEPLAVSPSTVPVGSSVVVSSPAAVCEIDYPPGTTYTVMLLADASGTSRETVAAVAEDGEFSATVDIPPDFPRGPATITILGSTFDECAEDPPPGVECAGYQVGLTVTE